MSRVLSLAMLIAAYAQESDEVVMPLLTIDHPELEEPLRFCLNGEDITSRDEVEDTLGITTDSRVRELAGQIVGKNIAVGLSIVNSVVADGLDLQQFNRGLVEYLR